MHAFILAGGFATRLWPLTEARPKPLLPLAGKPLLTHLVEGIPSDVPVTVSTNAAFGEEFHVWTKTLGRDNVAVIIEETKSDDEKLGALGATAQWLKNEQVADDILLLTGDNYLGFSITDFLATARPEHALVAAYDIGSLDAARAFGTVVLGQDGRSVTAFEEKPQHPKSTLVSTGCALLPESVLSILIEHAALHPDNVGGVFEELLRRGKNVDAFTFTEPWFDIGSFDAYLEATSVLVGEAIKAPESSRIGTSICEGSVVLGERCHVSGSTLKNVVTFDDCIIDDCVLENCIIDEGCVLRGVDLQKKMLRRQTNLIRQK